MTMVDRRDGSERSVLPFDSYLNFHESRRGIEDEGSRRNKSMGRRNGAFDCSNGKLQVKLARFIFARRSVMKQ